MEISSKSYEKLEVMNFYDLVAIFFSYCIGS